MDNAKFLKGLLAVVEKKQAALKKMAQGKPTTPFVDGTDDPNDPNYWDPLNPAIRSDPSIPGPPKPTAVKPAAPAPKAAPAGDFMAKLDSNPALAKLKGNLQITPNPKNPSVLDVKYYTGAWNQGATNLQKALSAALPGYRVNDPVGYIKLDFQPNYGVA